MDAENAAVVTNIGYLVRMSAPPHDVVLSRRTIDETDHAILELLARRRAIVKDLFAKKRTLGLPLSDPEREAALLEERQAFGRTLGVPAELVEAIFRSILADSHKIDASS